jgi:hypothetical protein
MRRITLTALAVLCTAALPLAAQDNKDAEQLFQKMEAKLDKAKAIDLSFDITVEEQFAQIRKGSRYKGTIAVMSGNKGRIEMRGEKAGGGEILKFLGISDGTKAIVIVGGEGTPKPGKTPKNYTATFLAHVARPGVLMSIMPLPPDVFAKEDDDFKDVFPVSDFKLGKKEKSGGRETQQVEYLLGVKGQKRTFPVTVWIDLKTALPVKRQVEGSYSETYELKLDGELDPKKFKLPSAQLPQDLLLGEWVNVDDVVFTAKRLVVSKGDNAWSVEAFVGTIMIVDGVAKEAEVSLAKTKLSLAGDSPDAKALPFGFTTRDLKRSVQYSTLRIEKEQLIVETFTIFSDQAGKSNYRTVEKFKKK